MFCQQLNHQGKPSGTEGKTLHIFKRPDFAEELFPEPSFALFKRRLQALPWGLPALCDLSAGPVLATESFSPLHLLWGLTQDWGRAVHG